MVVAESELASGLRINLLNLLIFISTDLLSALVVGHGSNLFAELSDVLVENHVDISGFAICHRSSSVQLLLLLLLCLDLHQL